MSKIRILNTAGEDVFILDLETGKATATDNVDMDEVAATFFRCLETTLYAIKNQHHDRVFREMLLVGAGGDQSGDFVMKPGILRLLAGDGYGAPGGDITMDPAEDPTKGRILLPAGEAAHIQGG